MRGTREHPRVEVRDGSTDPLLLPGPLADDDDVLLTFGRGLSIVARCADAWGADIDEDGKVVWFVPATEIGDGEGAPAHFTGVDTAQPSVIEDPVDVHVVGVPPIAYQDFALHFAELRREVRLLALATRAEIGRAHV